MSWVCAEGHHERCSEVVANWGQAQGGIVLRPCGCRECRHGPEPELVPAALRLIARLEADDG